MKSKSKVMMVLLIFMMVFVSDVFTQEFEMGFSPFYTPAFENLNSGIGSAFFVNFIKKRPMVLGINIGGYNTTTNKIHSGELFEFDDDYMVKWIDASIQYNRKVSYIGAGVGYYMIKYQLGEDINNYFQENDLLGSTNITNEVGFHVKGGINIWLSEKSYINLEVKRYQIEPTLTLKLTELNYLLSLSKDRSASLGANIISIGYGIVF